jgi:hypothetical protein
VLACAELLAATGAGLSLAQGGTPREPLLASGPLAEELEELQFTLGEGPCMAATARRSPVLVPDLAGPSAHSRWPVFAPAAVDHGVRAMFAFPVSAGAALVGVLDVYRSAPGSLRPQELADALVLTDAVLVLALDERGGIAPDLGNLLDTTVSARRAQVHQATGMVAAQLGVSMTDALAALRAYAYTEGRRLIDVAADVLARKVRLSGDQESWRAAVTGLGGSSGERGAEAGEGATDSPEATGRQGSAGDPASREADDQGSSDNQED